MNWNYYLNLHHLKKSKKKRLPKIMELLILVFDYTTPGKIILTLNTIRKLFRHYKKHRKK